MGNWTSSIVDDIAGKAIDKGYYVGRHDEATHMYDMMTRFLDESRAEHATGDPWSRTITVWNVSTKSPPASTQVRIDDTVQRLTNDGYVLTQKTTGDRRIAYDVHRSDE